MSPSSSPKSLEQRNQSGFIGERVAFIYTGRDTAVTDVLLGSWRTACFERHCILKWGKFKQHNFTETKLSLMVEHACISCWGGMVSPTLYCVHLFIFWFFPDLFPMFVDTGQVRSRGQEEPGWWDFITVVHDSLDCFSICFVIGLKNISS